MGKPCTCGCQIVVVQSVEVVSGFSYLWLTVLKTSNGEIVAQKRLNDQDPDHPSVATIATGGSLLYSGLLVRKNPATQKTEILAQNGKFYDKNLNLLRAMPPLDWGSLGYPVDPFGVFGTPVPLSFDAYDPGDGFRNPTMWLNDANVDMLGRIYIVGGFIAGPYSTTNTNLTTTSFGAVRYSADGITPEAIYQVAGPAWNSGPDYGFELTGVAPDETINPPGCYASVHGAGKMHWPGAPDGGGSVYDWVGGHPLTYAVRMLGPSQAAFAWQADFTVSGMGGVDFGGPTGGFAGTGSTRADNCFDIVIGTGGQYYCSTNHDHSESPRINWFANKFNNDGTLAWPAPAMGGSFIGRIGWHKKSHDVFTGDSDTPGRVMRLRNGDGSMAWDKNDGSIPGTVYAVRCGP